jgi:hypothetical protein
MEERTTCSKIDQDKQHSEIIQPSNHSMRFI